MTLAIAFKGPEGVVLAADSRVTLTYPSGTETIRSTFDNAIKLLTVPGQTHVAAVTYGLGALGIAPRTAHSFLPEIGKELAKGLKKGKAASRLSVEEFATRLGKFFAQQHKALGTPTLLGEMFFYVAGYDEGDAHGKLYAVSVPSAPTPVEMIPGQFGIQWGGQTEITSRIFLGWDIPGMSALQAKLAVSNSVMHSAVMEAQSASALKIPFDFLPLQDCVDLSILIVRTTAEFMRYTTDIRGVGGKIDVVTITQEGVTNVQRKAIQGERRHD